MYWKGTLNKNNLPFSAKQKSRPHFEVCFFHVRFNFTRIYVFSIERL